MTRHLACLLLVVAVSAAGCSSSSKSSKPAYCQDAANLKTSVQALKDVNVVKDGVSSLTSALSTVQTNAQSLSSDAKSNFGTELTALQQSLGTLGTAVQSASGQPVLQTAQAVGAALAGVKTSADALQTAVGDKCK